MLYNSDTSKEPVKELLSVKDVVQVGVKEGLNGLVVQSDFVISRKLQSIDLIAVFIESFLESKCTADIIQLNDSALVDTAICFSKSPGNTFGRNCMIGHAVLDDSYNEQGNKADEEMGAYMAV